MTAMLDVVDIPHIALDPFGEEFLGDPFAYHGAMRDAGPVFWLERWGVYGMARFAEVKSALEDWRTFCSGRGVGLSDFSKEEPWRPPSLLLETDPPVHDRTRKIVSTIVSLSALRERRRLWEQHADALVDRLVSKRRFDCITELAEVYPLMVFPDAIGIREHGREHLLPYAAAAFNAFGPRNQIFESTKAAAQSAVAWVNESCKRTHLRSGGWGMAVHEAADRGDCTEAEAERLVRSFLTAGMDTTVNGIGNMMLACATHPEQWCRLREDPTLVKRAFEEALRWDSTVQTFFRTTTRQVGVGCTQIPEGSKVLLFLAAANRDPRRWADADQFVIDRMPSGHVGFGFGIHQCVGQMVARLEAELILVALLRRVKTFRLMGPPIRKLNNTLHALSSMPVEIVPV